MAGGIHTPKGKTERNGAFDQQASQTHLSDREIRSIVDQMIERSLAEPLAQRRLPSRRVMIAAAVGFVAAVLLGFAFNSVTRGGDEATAAVGPDPEAFAPAPTIDDAQGVAFEKFALPDPALPAVPAGETKKFRVEVFEHVAQVHAKLAPTKVWSYAVNGVEYRGTGGSPPMVVNEGDRVKIDLVNGGSAKMSVIMPHSIDFHSAEVAPNSAYVTIPPGGKHSFEFTADHPGTYMYHCATKPVLLHTGAGMVGMMIVKPKGLPPVDREFWLTQQEFYIGKPGEMASYPKMTAKNPDVIAFNGFGDQYATKPIVVDRGEKVRVWLLNAGPSIWSAFHMIGTVFDRVEIEGTPGRDAQTVNLAPSQGGWVEFSLDAEGQYPFVTHSFGDMTKGAMGIFETSHAKHPNHGGGGH